MKIKTLCLALAITAASPLIYAENGDTSSSKAKADVYLKGEKVAGEVPKTKEQHVVTFKVAGMKDKDGNDISYTAGQSAVIEGKGTITIKEDGSYTFDPERNYFGTIPLITCQFDTGDDQDLTIAITPEDLKEYRSEINSTAINAATSGTQSEAVVSQTTNLIANINAAVEQGKISPAKAKAWIASIELAGVPVPAPASPS